MERISVPTFGDLYSRPGALGRAFFVDSSHGFTSDDNEGTDPNFPLTTIAQAITKCTSSWHNYIFVMTCTEEAEITLTKHEIHFIGISERPVPVYGVMLYPPGDTAMLNIAGGWNCEFAGFIFGAGATHGAIESDASGGGAWIHHNVFGSELPNYPDAGTPAYGILMSHSPSGDQYMLIEDNWFHGTELGCQGTIDAIAVCLWGPKGLILRRNTFKGMPDPAVEIAEGAGMTIVDNLFVVPDDAHGRAITLTAEDCRGCLIKGNVAVNGLLNAGYTYNPYRDLALAQINHWGMNYRGNSVIEPVTA